MQILKRQGSKKNATCPLCVLLDNVFASFLFFGQPDGVFVCFPFSLKGSKFGVTAISCFNLTDLMPELFNLDVSFFGIYGYVSSKDRFSWCLCGSCWTGPSGFCCFHTKALYCSTFMHLQYERTSL